MSTRALFNLRADLESALLFRKPMKKLNAAIVTALILLTMNPPVAQGQEFLSAEDVFNLEWVSDPQISPDASSIAYVRNSFDKWSDGTVRQVWLVSSTGSNNRPIYPGDHSSRAPKWSPDGSKLVFVSNESESNQIYLRWTDSGQVFKISELEGSPSNMTWSPDGTSIAFTMFVEESAEKMAKMPKTPKGAEWADPPVVIRSLKFQSDGGGFDKTGVSQIFVIPMEGGVARQVTEDKFGFSGSLTWSPDGQHLFASSNKRSDKELEARDSEIYKIAVYGSDFNSITNRRGPDTNPLVSPDGKKIAYLGFEDQLLGFQAQQVTVQEIDGGRILWTSNLDDGAAQLQWSKDSNALYFSHDHLGNGKISRLTKDKSSLLASNKGGTSVGRPYGGGSYSTSDDDTIAYTHSTPHTLSELAILRPDQKEPQIISSVNSDLFSYRKLGTVEELWYKSSFDGTDIQSWVVYPPDFDSSKKYPLLLEIHGGPFANYGDRFSAEAQLYASAGYIVLYVNPRGSTSYGSDFANLIHHNYPGEDYDDLISGVDKLIEKGNIDEERLFVTGGSGGGVLTAWIIGKTTRFKAAVVAKPVINWFSFVLTADNPQTYYKYWFPSAPWEDPEHYYKRSPISLVGNVETPTMLLTGEEDRRTPMSETEQYYAALKIRGVPSAMVRIPGAGHGIAARPSQLIAKVLHVLAWFEEHQN